MRKIFATAILIVVSASSFAAPISCGGATGELNFEKSIRHKGDVESIVSVIRDGRSTILRYDGGIDFIGMECRKTKSGKPMLVFQAYCGGSACRDLDNYGIIDPSDLRVLLVPSDTNRKLAKQILEIDPAPIPETESISVISKRLFSK
jgi:hypothetical protein